MNLPQVIDAAVVRRYAVRPFDLFDQGGVTIVFTQTSAAQVDDEAVRRLLRGLRDLGRTELDRDDIWNLCSQYGVSLDDAIEFLSDQTEILRPALDRTKASYQKLQIITDSELFQRAARTHFDAMGVRVLDDRSVVDDRTLTVFFLETYDEARIRQIYARAKHDAYLSVQGAYIYERSLFIDSLYLSGEGVPCHFCVRGTIQASAHTARDPAALRWRYFSEILEAPGKTHPSLPINDLQRGLVNYLICQRLEFLIGQPQRRLLLRDLFSTIEVDLDSGKSRSTVYPHWQLCGCSRMEWT